MATEVRVIETGESPFAVRIEVGGFTLAGDEPSTAGGGGLGPSPFDLLAAALAECTAMTVRWYARQQGWPLERVEVALSHAKGGEGAASPRQDVFEKCIRLIGPQLSDAQRAKLADVAARCPVQRTLEGSPLIRTRCTD
jgi:putative redox protein